MRIWLRRASKQSSSIQRFKADRYDNELIEHLEKQITAIDQKISSVSQALLQAQIVNLRANLSVDQGLLGKIKNKFYSSTSQESVSWHRDELMHLNKKRKRIRIQLEKLNGTFWKNRIKRWLSFALILIPILFLIWILLMGLITAIYLLPIWGTIIIIYVLIKRNSPRRY